MKRSPKIMQHQAGFTIVELAIVLTVIAMIAGGALAVGASRLEASKINTTNERIDFLMEALGVYVKQYCNLPCPASPSISGDHADFGLGKTTESPDPHACNSQDIARDATTNVVAGAVPARTLKISPVLMIDGWGRRMAYVVDEELTLKGDGITTGYSTPSVVGQIQILPSNAGTEVTNEAAVLVMSYGTNGHGAWRGKGGSRLDKDTSDADEPVNSWDGNGVSGDGAFDNSFVQKFTTATFDDIVQYRIKWQLPDSPSCTN